MLECGTIHAIQTTSVRLVLLKETFINICMSQRNSKNKDIDGSEYEFQMLLWWGIYVASLPVLRGAEYLVIVGPVFLTLLLFFVSGIPLLEVLSLSLSPSLYSPLWHEINHTAEVNILLFIWMQASADKKYGSSAAYRHYKKTTRYDMISLKHHYWPWRCVIRARCFSLFEYLVYSPLILFPRGVYGYLPKWCKTVFLFEFPFYSRNLPQETTVWWVFRILMKPSFICLHFCVKPTNFVLLWTYELFTFYYAQGIEGTRRRRAGGVLTERERELQLLIKLSSCIGSHFLSLNICENRLIHWLRIH